MQNEKEIREAVQKYLDGLYEGNADLLETVFHPTSALVREQNGTLLHTPVAEWLKAVRGRPSPKARGIERKDQWLHLDQTGPTMAFAKVQANIPPRNPIDYLSLLKVDGKWQIVEKVFAVEAE
jgi:hypothetical protein